MKHTYIRAYMHTDSCRQIFGWIDRLGPNQSLEEGSLEGFCYVGLCSRNSVVHSGVLT